MRTGTLLAIVGVVVSCAGCHGNFTINYRKNVEDMEDVMDSYLEEYAGSNDRGAVSLTFKYPSSVTAMVGQLMVVKPTILDGGFHVITSCKIKASTTALPAWAAIDGTTCVISGTPDAPLSATTYTLVASNAGGMSAEAKVELTVELQSEEPEFSWKVLPDEVWVKGSVPMNATLGVNDEAQGIVSYEIALAESNCVSESWSVALSINQAGEIAGTPSAVSNVRSCQISVSASANGKVIHTTLAIRIYPDLPEGFTCDEGSVDTVCAITTTKTLSDGDVVAGPGQLVVKAEGELTAPTGQRVSIVMKEEVAVESGGKITANLSLLSADVVTIAADGTINVSGRGYAANSGPGNGSTCTSTSGSGGSHAGKGGLAGGGCQAPLVYGDPLGPVSFGSGGGRTSNPIGGAGGGAVKLEAATVIVDGSILANGMGGDNSIGCDNKGGGGGAGGSIWIMAESFMGTGTIQASGGQSGKPTHCGANNPHAGGGGSGGYILLDTPQTFAGSVSVSGGSQSSPAGESLPGEAGRLVVKQTNICDDSESDDCVVSRKRFLDPYATLQIPGNLIVMSGGSISTGSSSSLGALKVSGNMVIRDGASVNLGLYELSASALKVEAEGIANLDIKSGHLGEIEVVGKISGTIGTYTASSLLVSGTVTANIEDLTVSGSVSVLPSGMINVDGRGFIGGAGTGPNGSGQGPGGGSGGGTSGGGGGGHAGAGGKGDAQAGGGSYGDELAPITLGSGGGNSWIYRGGAGGGALKLRAGGPMVIDGIVSARGIAGHTGLDCGENGGGGGAGGSIWLIAEDSLTGSGVIRADGGAGGRSSSCTAGDGGGGGGGYLKLDGNLAPDNGLTFSVTGGKSGGGLAEAGEAGRICIDDGGTVNCN